MLLQGTLGWPALDPKRTHSVYREIVHIIKKQQDKCSGNQRKTVVIILPGETVTEIVIDLLVRIHISRELSVADGGCVGRIPKVSIYSFLHSFAHCTFLN